MSEAFKSYLLVGAGSALGGMARFWLSGIVAQRFEQFPMGTLVVNISGSFIIGLLGAMSAPEGRGWLSPGAREFLMIGILGGYTTFSSFSLQTLNLLRAGQWLYGGGNIALSVVLCLVAVWFGHFVGQVFNR